MRNEALDARGMRAAKNQSLQREVNERTIDLACECMDTTCTERVVLTVAEYETTRADSNPFVVVPGHDVSAVEEFKLRSGAAVAERLDPVKADR